MTNEEAHSFYELLKLSKEKLVHIECLKSKICQETESLKGTEHEGVDVCEDGCVWYDPRTKPTNPMPNLE